jgi:RNA-directed DNA polymerase
MKRQGNLYSKICHIENLILAEKKARRGKKNTYGVTQHDKNRGCNLITLQNQLMSLEFTTSPYTTFIIKEPKEREIFRLPFYPDRICHHAIMNVLEKIWVGSFTKDTYG